MTNKLDKDYYNLLEDIINNGIKKKTRNGDTLSVFGRTIRHKMSDGFPLLTTKKMYWKGIVVELLWFLRGDTNIKYLIDNDCHIWNGDAIKNFEKQTREIDWGRFITKEEAFVESMSFNDFAAKWGELGPIYGKQWRDWGGKHEINYILNTKTRRSPGIDQIANLINELKTNPDSRRLMVNAWNVGELDQMVLPPCHYGFQLYTRELTGEERWELLKNKVGEEQFKSMVDDIVPFGGGLSHELQYHNIPRRAVSLMWNQRSVDTFLGLPFNIGSYGLLLTILAKEVNMVPEELIGNLGDTHLYVEHIESAKEQMNRTPYELPQLKIDDTVKWKEGDCLPSYSFGDFTLENYQYHPTIRAELKN